MMKSMQIVERSRRLLYLYTANVTESRRATFSLTLVYKELLETSLSLHFLTIDFIFFFLKIETFISSFQEQISSWLIFLLRVSSSSSSCKVWKHDSLVCNLESWVTWRFMIMWCFFKRCCKRLIIWTLLLISLIKQIRLVAS